MQAKDEIVPGSQTAAGSIEWGTESSIHSPAYVGNLVRSPVDP